MSSEKNKTHILRKTALTIVIIVILWQAARLITGIVVPPFPPHPLQEKPMTVIAHQGGKNLLPENTLPAFENALRVGADALEMDVHLTKDGHLVVIHDDTVDRTTNGSGSVAEFSLRELKELDAAYRWQEGDNFPYRGQGIRIPTLTEILEQFPDTIKIIEMKPDDPNIAAALGTMLREWEQDELVIVGSFHIDILKRFRRNYPEFMTSAGLNEVARFFVMNHLGFSGSYPFHFGFFQVPVQYGPLKVVTSSFIKNAQRNNIIVQAWTINDPDEMRELLNMGINGIITDDPETLKMISEQ